MSLHKILFYFLLTFTSSSVLQNVLSSTQCSAFVQTYDTRCKKSIPLNRSFNGRIDRRRNYEEDKDDDDEEEEEDITQLPALVGSTTSENKQQSKSSSTIFSASFTPSNLTATTFVTPKFQLQYTCNVCETRNRVLISRIAYREGMVIAICKGCQSKHWIADNLDPTLHANNIEEFFSSQGMDDKVNRVSQDVYEVERVWDFAAGQVADDNGKPVLE
jgi:hypothetical protein